MTTKDFIITTLRNNKIRLAQLGVKEVGLFGSYLRNEHTPNSDIDILIDFETGKENFDNYINACRLVEALFDKEKVEIVTKNGLSPYIGPRILNEVVYV